MRGNSEERAFTIALVQMAISEDPEANLQRALEEIAAGARRGAQLVCLPELFRTRYFCQAEDSRFFDLAEPVPGPTTDALCAAASREKVAIIGSLFERRAPGLYHNTAVVIGPDGSLQGLYRKMHIPHDPSFYEKFYFAPGDLGFPAFSLGVARVSVLVCWDQWFPEAARLAVLGGAEILVYPTAIGWLCAEKAAFGPAQRESWEIVQRAHAIANGVFVAAVNRVGREDQLEFWGSSFVTDPLGRLIARAGEYREETLLVRCDLRLVEETRRNWPFLRDRRVDAYAGLLRQFLDR